MPEPFAFSRYMDPEAHPGLAELVVPDSGFTLQDLPMGFLRHGNAGVRLTTEAAFQRVLNEPGGTLQGVSTEESRARLEEGLQQVPTALDVLEAEVVKTSFHLVKGNHLVVYVLRAAELGEETTNLSNLVAGLNHTPAFRMIGRKVNRRLVVASLPQKDPGVRTLRRVFEAARPESVTLMPVKAQTATEIRVYKPLSGESS